MSDDCLLGGVLGNPEWNFHLQGRLRWTVPVSARCEHQGEVVVCRGGTACRSELNFDTLRFGDVWRGQAYADLISQSIDSTAWEDRGVVAIVDPKAALA